MAVERMPVAAVLGPAVEGPVLAAVEHMPVAEAVEAAVPGPAVGGLVLAAVEHMPVAEAGVRREALAVGVVVLRAVAVEHMSAAVQHMS
ncbi:MAG: hypothetical protein HY290_15830, partial [Planctomycetia bacterium]|nr:hypothetical protein [Planctomycetia bacterium]